MQTQTKINNTTINTQAAQTFSMSEKAQQLAEECVTRKSLLIALSESHCFSDAIMLLSYAMPYQKGLQWALKCVHANSQGQSRQKDNAPEILEAAEKWLTEPTEQNRADILPTRTIAQPTAATWLAMATYWSGGSISDSPIVKEAAPNGLVNESIYSSVMLSVQEVEENSQLSAYSNAVNQGIKLLYA